MGSAADGGPHANMGIYKWAYKLTPSISSDLLFDAFDLACAARELDMKAP
ncbi:hypothetical protein ACFV4K_11270 [Nocardia sp. NPDC059764]